MFEAKPYFYGTGRRKSSVARVRLVPGTGDITINGKNIDTTGLSCAYELTCKRSNLNPILICNLLAFYSRSCRTCFLIVCVCS